MTDNEILENQKMQREQIFFEFLQNGLLLRIENKQKILEEKAKKLLSISLFLFSLSTSILGFISKEFSKYIGLFLYLIPVLLAIYISVFYCFKFFEVKKGKGMGAPSSFKIAYESNTNNQTFLEELNEHYCDYITYLKDRNKILGEYLRIASKLILLIFFSVPVGILLYTVSGDTLKFSENIILLITVSIGVVFISIFIVFLIISLKKEN